MLKSGSKLLRDPQRCRALVLLFAALLMPAQALAQAAQNSGGTYRLTSGDQIQLEVPGHPDLSLLLTVNGKGGVPVPRVGEVAVAGLSLDEAELVLRQRLRLFDPSIDSVNLELGDQVAAMRIYVIGEVVSSGEFSFPKDPTLWDVIRAAGGPSDGANLARSRVVRETDGVSEAFVLDLSQIMVGGHIPEFQLKGGDTLVIPAMRETGTGLNSSLGGVQVLGGVRMPSVVPIQEPTPLLEVIMMAGSPTEEALLNDIFWVHRSGEEWSSRNVNLNTFLENGNPLGNPLIYPGDAVHVKFERANWWQRNLPLILSTLSATATLYIAYNNAND